MSAVIYGYDCANVLPTGVFRGNIRTGIGLPTDPLPNYTIYVDQSDRSVYISNGEVLVRYVPATLFSII